tara:strand:+ start:98 stop:409 length:312 start_codon:yes stop_codon:yes gene_type:complete
MKITKSQLKQIIKEELKAQQIAENRKYLDVDTQRRLKLSILKAEGVVKSIFKDPSFQDIEDLTKSNIPKKVFYKIRQANEALRDAYEMVSNPSEHLEEEHYKE